MYSYTICTEPDRAMFRKLCAALERYIPGLKKEESLLEDVDGTLIQHYKKDGAEIAVWNDELVGALYMDSEIDLAPFSQQLPPWRWNRPSQE